MKKWLLLLLLFPFSLRAQNCTDVKSRSVKGVHSKTFDCPDTLAVQFTKIITGKDTFYHVHLRVEANAIHLNESGVIIQFSDGTKLEKPDEKIDVNPMDKGFEYVVKFSLSNEEMNTF